VRVVHVIALAAVGMAACWPGDLDLTGRRCPCAAGWVCGPDDICVLLDAAVAPMDARPDAPAPMRDAAGADASDALVLPDAPPPIDAPVGPEPPWWDLAWGERARMLIANGASSSAPSGLEVALAIDLAALPGATRASLRVVRWDDGARSWTVIARHVDDPPAGRSESRIWLALDAPIAAGDTDETYWLYWNEPTAPDDDRPSDVFTFYDDFDGTALASDWAAQNPLSVTGGELELSPGASIRSTSGRVQPGEAVDFALRVPGWSGTSYYWAGLQRESDFDDTQPWMIWINRDSDPDELWPEVQVDAIGASGAGAHFPMDGALHRYSVERLADRVAFGRDDAEVSVLALGASYTTPLQIRIRTSSGGPTMFVPWVRVRTVLRPPPALSLEATEPRP
jgi:hypothetical protein